MNQNNPHDILTSAITRQIENWPLAKRNYHALNDVRQKECGLIRLQFNPARAVSTGASVKPSDIANRPCFLCHNNRPAEQISLDTISEYEVLVNPFPIFPTHLTISHKDHIPQFCDLNAMADFVERYPDMVAFYNGASSGASAPDHCHFQATTLEKMDLIFRIEKEIPQDIKSTDPAIFGDYNVGMYVTDCPDTEDLVVTDKYTGINPDTNKADSAYKNVLVWRRHNGVVRIATIPRRCHRPKEYYAQDSTQRMVSPGAVDVAGIIITPRRSDFDNLTIEEMDNIFRQTTFTPSELKAKGNFTLQ